MVAWSLCCFQNFCDTCFCHLEDPWIVELSNNSTMHALQELHLNVRNISLPFLKSAICFAVSFEGDFFIFYLGSKNLAQELSYGGYFILLSSIQLIKWASMFVTLHKQSQPASKNWRKKIIYFRTEVESPSKLQLRIISSWPIGIFRQIDQFFSTATSKQWFRG